MPLVRHGPTPSSRLDELPALEAEAEPPKRALRAGGKRPQLYRAEPGDASTFISDTIRARHAHAARPAIRADLDDSEHRHGGLGRRRLQRQGPLTGPGLIHRPAL